MSATANTKTAKMRPRARLISLIGEELISDEPVAVVELVKNSYDADASEVRVSFQGATPERFERIVITDDGHGVAPDRVEQCWLEPGTIAKRETERSPKGRVYQGAKGIGRFAAARLAEVLLLESKAESSRSGVRVCTNWGDFEETSFLDDIKITYEIGPIPDLPRGTRITLQGLRKSWEAKDFEELHSRLSRLISPFDEVRGFRVLLDIPSYPELSGSVEPPELILKPKYVLRGSLDKDGRMAAEFELEGSVTERIPSLKLGAREQKPTCGPFSFEIRAWDRDREGLQPLVEELGKGIRQIRSTLDAYCGVSIYRGGFRVHPYGEKGNDWLNLDLRSRLNPVKDLANNQIVGAIRISRSANPKLQDRSTREGMVLNAEHRDLEQWFKEVLSQIEERRYKARPRKESMQDAHPLFEPFDLGSTIREARVRLGPGHPLALLISEKQKEVNAGVERLQEAYSRILMLAGVGQMVDIVIHEIGAPLGKLNRQISILEDQLPRLVEPPSRHKISPMLTSMKSWCEQIHNLRERLEPQKPAKRGRATSFNVEDEVEDICTLYDALVKKQAIRLDLKFPRHRTLVKMSRASLGQILANLVDNSLYWVTRHHGHGKGGTIQVRVSGLRGGFAVAVADDGPGVVMDDRVSIFEPYFTKKPNGMGLGLYIARLVIEPYGRLLYQDDGELPGACFEALFERNVGL
jgi:signal transduction histidine kinase